MMDEETIRSIKEEIEQDLREISRRDELLRTDYDFFKNHFHEEITAVQEALDTLMELHDEYEWSFDLEEALS